MATALPRFVRVPGVQNHHDRGDGIGDSEENALYHTAERFPSAVEAGGEKCVAAVGGAVLQEVNRQHHEHHRLQKGLPQWRFLDRFQFCRFPLQRGLQILAFLRRNPWRLAGMVADEMPPDGQPDERQRAFQNEHRLPTPTIDQPAGDGSGTRHRQRLAQIPVGVGSRAFVPGKPVGQQHQRGWKYPALRNPEHEAHQLEVAECRHPEVDLEKRQLDVEFRKPRHQPASDRKNPPKNQQQAHEFFRAPAVGEVASGNLQQHVAEKENTGDVALHLVVHEQVLHQGRELRVQGQGHVGAVDVRDGVHDQRHRNDAQPAFLLHSG